MGYMLNSFSNGRSVTLCTETMTTAQHTKLSPVQYVHVGAMHKTFQLAAGRAYVRHRENGCRKGQYGFK
jgi:hypothetical protein